MNILQFQVTDKCGNNCDFCLKKKSGTITRKMIDLIFSQIANIKVERGLKIIRLVITGGDPLLIPKKLLVYLINNGYSIFNEIAINTSFCRLDILSDILRVFDPRRGEILSSLHAPTPKQHNMISRNANSFQSVTEGIKMCNQYGVKIGINMVVNDTNWGLIEEQAVIVKKIGADFLFVSPEVHFLQTASNQTLIGFFERLHKINQQNVLPYIDTEVCVTEDWFSQQGITKGRGFARSFCPTITNALYITADGNVYPCLANQQLLGNITDDGLASIINGSCLVTECQFRRKGGVANMSAKEAVMTNGWLLPDIKDFKSIFGKIGEIPIINVMKRCACVCHSACACKCACVCSGSCTPRPTGKCPW